MLSDSPDARGLGRRWRTELALRKLIAGNWKMNGLRADGLALGARPGAAAPSASRLGCDLLVCPPATLVWRSPRRSPAAASRVGGQDCHATANGAHTGEISAEMLQGCRLQPRHPRPFRAPHRSWRDRRAGPRQGRGGAARRAARHRLRRRDPAQSASRAGARRASRGQLAGSLPDGVDRGAAGRRLRAGLGDRHRAHADRRRRRRGARAISARELGGALADAAAVRILYGGSVKPDNAAELLARGRRRRRAGRRRQPQGRRFLGDRQRRGRSRALLRGAGIARRTAYKSASRRRYCRAP